MKIKKGDTVQVLSGNDKGKTGEVLEVIPKTERIIVKGINIRKKHIKNRTDKPKYKQGKTYHRSSWTIRFEEWRHNNRHPGYEGIGDGR